MDPFTHRYPGTLPRARSPAYLFESNGVRWRLLQTLDLKLAVLFDEDHNVVERARRTYSTELRISQLHA